MPKTVFFLLSVSFLAHQEVFTLHFKKIFLRFPLLFPLTTHPISMKKDWYSNRQQGLSLFYVPSLTCFLKCRIKLESVIVS